MSELASRYETMKGEHLKTVAERSLFYLGQSRVGQNLIENYAFGLDGRIIDDRLRTSIAGVDLENPVMTGPGWDKKGLAVVGLYALGFAGSEVGTVPLFGQPGQLRPRLWTIDEHHSVGLNRMGFNSEGAEGVSRNLARHSSIPGVLGINAGRNKDLLNEHSPGYHAAVVSMLGSFADYFVFNPSSPNTEGLRDLQQRTSIIEHVTAMRGAAEGKPVLVKLAPDMTNEQLAEATEASIESGAAAMILANTTISLDIKAKYGERWAKEAGGLSGDDPEYRDMTTGMVRFVYKNYGAEIEVVGVGGVKDYKTALEKITAGASCVQVVTAIRPTKGKVAANIVRGLSDFMDKHRLSSVSELVGLDERAA